MSYLSIREQKIYKLKFETRSFVSLYPKLFFPLMLLMGKYPGRSVQKNTELVIEGFPRSANSFSIGAFLSVQPHPVVLASHLHAAAQIIRAARLSIPTLVLIRSPIDAVTSFRSLELEIMDYYGDINHKLHIPLKNYLRNWILFYSRIIPYKNNYVVGLFDEVTNDFGLITKKINERFNTDFAIFEHTEENVKIIHNQQGFHSGPSKKRQSFKATLMKEFENEDIQSLIDKAEDIYRQFEIFAKS